MIRPLLDASGIAALREALDSAGYTSAGIAERIGPLATAAVRRGDLRGALHSTVDRDRLGTLIRLYVCGETEPTGAVAAALAPLALADAEAAGLVERHDDGWRQGVDLESYQPDPTAPGAGWWVVADVPASARPGQPLPGDHVLGVGGASSTLAAATVRSAVGSALDLGTGCGVQALHLSTHAGTVTATDLSDRALRFAATTAALNGQDWELLAGDLTAPVAGRRFDLVVSNPPFVVGPGTATHAYRDSGRVSDGVCAELAAAAPGLLTEGGTMQYLANWVHVNGEDWAERVTGWVAGTGLDAWVIQREVTDPVTYVRLWLGDAAEPVDSERAAAWLDWFDRHKVEAVGFGLVNLRAGGHDSPVVRVEDLRQTVEPPFGDRIAEWFARHRWLRDRPADALLATRFRAADGVLLRQEATLAGEGWSVDRQVLVLPGGLRWQDELDPLAVALVAGADGRATLGEQLSVLALGYEVPLDDLTEVAGSVVTHLVERGYIAPES